MFTKTGRDVEGEWRGEGQGHACIDRCVLPWIRNTHWRTLLRLPTLIHPYCVYHINLIYFRFKSCNTQMERIQQICGYWSLLIKHHLLLGSLCDYCTAPRKITKFYFEHHKNKCISRYVNHLFINMYPMHCLVNTEPSSETIIIVKRSVYVQN